MNKDWVGDTHGMFVTIGSSSHTDHDRAEHDYYATEPCVIDELFAVEQFSGNIWEPACGEGHLSKEIEKYAKVLSTDLIDRGYGEGNIDFLEQDSTKHMWLGDIITNPPYKYAQDFVEKAMDLICPGFKVAMFLKLTFLEGKKRREMFNKYPPKMIYVYSSRRKCAMNGNFDAYGSSASCYAWFVWEKGFTGDPTIKWL